MARPTAAVFLLLLYLTSGAALEVTTPPSHRSQLGSTITLPCQFTVTDSKINFMLLTILWQLNGNIIVRFDTKAMDSDQRRFINKEDLGKGIADLHIHNVTTSDIGTYRCTVIYSPESESRETALTVYAPPVITYLGKVIAENEQDRFLCSVDGFYPRDITVKLLKDGKVIEGSVATSHVKDDGTFSINNTVIISPEEQPKVLMCKVQHEAAELQQTLLLVYKGDNDVRTGMAVGITIGLFLLLLLIIAVVLYKKKSGLQEIVVSNIQGTPWMDGEKTTLHCTASYCTKDVMGKWVIKHPDGTTCEISETPTGDKEEEQPLMSREYKMTTEKIPSQKRKGFYDMTTKLTFIPSISRHLGSDVICVFGSDKKVEEKTYIFKSIQAKPKFIEPIQVILSNHQDVQLSAIIQRFYPKTMEITWVCNNGQSQEIKTPSEEEIMVNPDATFSMKSKCTIPGERFRDPTFKVIVMWKHESMDIAQSKELSVKDLPWHPTIQDGPIQVIFQDDDAHLQCAVSNYFPDALSVKWFQKQKGSRDLIEILRSEKYKIPEITSNQTENKTFTSRAVLSFKRSLLSKKDVEFICRVDHPSLKAPIQSSTGYHQDTDNQDFIINNIQGPQKWFDGEKVTLYCSALLCMEDSKVTWIVIRKDGTSQEISESPPGEEMRRGGLQFLEYLALRERTDLSDKEGLLDITSSLSFTPSVSKHENVTIGCKISSGGSTKQKIFQLKYLFAKPKVLTPIKLSLTDSGEVLCSLNIEGFYPENIQIKWNETMIPDKPSKNNDGTFDAHSEYKLPGSFFKNPESTLIVSWKHESMENWDSRQVSVLDKAFPWKPEVKDIPVPNLLIGSVATLKCEVSNVFPDVLHVRWLKKERDSQDLFPPVPSDKYSVSEMKPDKQKDNTFTYKTCLKFRPTINTEEGAEFICRVEHPSLDKAIEKSTGPLSIKGFPAVKDIACSDQGTYSLDVDRVYPQKTTVSWKLLGSSSTEESEPLISSVTCKVNGDGSYIVTSICDLRKSIKELDKWNVLQAAVEHETLDTPIYKRIDIKNNDTLSPEKGTTVYTLQKSEDVTSMTAMSPQKDDYQKIIVGNIQGPQRWVHGEKVTLYCSVTDCPENVSVTWMVTESDDNKVTISNVNAQDAQSTSGYSLTRETDRSDIDGLFNVTSLLTLTPSVAKHVGTCVTCTITSNGKTLKIKKFQMKSINAKLVPGDVKTTLCDSGDVLCSLDLCNIYPKQLTLKWTTAGKKLPSTEEWTENTEKIFTLRSQCTISQHLLMDPRFTVCVTWKHKSMDKEESRVVSGRDLGYAWCPEIQEVPIPHIMMSKKNTLQYNISRYFPDAVSVSWYKKEKGEQILKPLSDSETYTISTTKSQRQPDNTYSCTACLVFSPLIKDQGSEIICRVEHPNLETPLERSSGALHVMAQPNKKKPVKLTLGKEEIKYSLFLENFCPKDVHIQWYYGSGHQPTQTSLSKEKDKNNLDKTFTVSSECRLSEKLLHIPDFRVRVTWNHESMDDPGCSELSIRDTNYPWRPVMEISVPRLRMNEEATVQCTISKYFPNLLNVMWLRKDRPSGETRCVSSNEMYKVSNNDLGRQSDNTYSCKSCLTFIPTLEAGQDVEFICQVQHPSLVQALEKSTGPLEITETFKENPPQVHGHHSTGYENPPQDHGHHSTGYENPHQDHGHYSTGYENPPQVHGHHSTGYENPPQDHGHHSSGYENPPQYHDHHSSGYENPSTPFNANNTGEALRQEVCNGEEEMDIT